MMPHKGRKHRPSLPCDILSNLPDNLIDAILICLPCKDAVKTSVLAKKWRYHWCRRTEFELYESYDYWKSRNNLLKGAVNFTNIINQILTLHEGHITKFTLYIQNLQSCPKIDDLIYFLSMNGIQELVLRFPRNEPYKMPFSLFTCSVLTSLSLQNCFIHPPWFFNGFDWLISLELCQVIVCPELLGSLISKCPLLEQLVLKDTVDLGITEIEAPMLKSFDFQGSISSICLKDVPLLSEICLVGDDSTIESENFGFAKVFKSCYALEHLSIRLQDIDEDPGLVPPRLPFDLNHVKHLYVGDMVLEEDYRLACALCLIRSFPFLESLEIEISHEYEFGFVEWLRMGHFSGVTFNYLRQVKLLMFGGTKPERQLVKLLLAKSPVLERMLIDTIYLDNEPPVTRSRSRSRSRRSRAFSSGCQSLQEVIATLSKFQHASPKAKIVYKKLK